MIYNLRKASAINCCRYNACLIGELKGLWQLGNKAHI